MCELDECETVVVVIVVDPMVVVSVSIALSELVEVGIFPVLIVGAGKDAPELSGEAIANVVARDVGAFTEVDGVPDTSRTLELGSTGVSDEAKDPDDAGVDCGWVLALDAVAVADVSPLSVELLSACSRPEASACSSSGCRACMRGSGRDEDASFTVGSLSSLVVSRVTR